MTIFRAGIPLLCLLACAIGPAGRAAEGDNAVSCLGRLVPGREVTLVEVPFFTQEPPIVTELLVKAGDRVEKGQPLARTHHYAIAAAMLKESEAALVVAEKSLELTRAGAEPTTVAAQKAQLESLTASAKLAENLYQRRLALAQHGEISSEEVDTARLKTEISQKNREQAELTLRALTTVQKEKIALGEAEVEKARSALARSQAMLSLTEIRAPLGGMILRVFAHPGEKAERQGLLEMGDVARMRVQAEVYVSDIRFVRVGQQAEIRGEAFAGKLGAVVEAIDPLVRPNRFLDVSPKSVRENRVVTVWLTMDDPARVETLSGAEASVVIQP